MSCITEILKKKGDTEALYIPHNDNAMDLIVEGGGHYKEYEYLITFNDMGFRCGYIAIPTDHKFYDNNFMDNDEELEVHGGITFSEQHSLVEDILGKQCTDKWIGFDAGHFGDIPDIDATLKYFPHLREARKNHVIEMAHIFEKDCFNHSMKTFEYMEDECKSLIDQLIEKAA
jgi:hypothetical protein